MNVDALKGVTVALVTPFDERQQVDEGSLRALVDWQIESGTHALLATGTTGEASTMTVAEQLKVIEIVLEAARDRVPVICGTGANSTAEAIQLSRPAAALGCAALLLVVPYYNKPTQEGLFRHFQAVAEAVETPIILYNVPGRAGTNMTAETTLRLAQLPQFIGVKEASGDLTQIMHILRERPADFLVLSGDDAFAYPVMALGGDGAISVVANQVPAEMSEMADAARNLEWERARDLHYRLLPLMEANFLESNPIPVKASLAMMGRLVESYRLPLCAISEVNRARLQQVLSELGLV